MNSDSLAEELIAILIEELRDQARAMRAELRALAGGTEPQGPLKTLYRIAHTLKGSSRAADVPELEEAAREIEARIVTVQGRGGPPREAELAWLGAAADRLDGFADRLGSRAPAAPRRDRARETARPSAPLRVLAVEDSPTQATKLHAALERGGYAIVEARSGEDALELFASEPVDFVVSDVMMPGAVDGYELCRRIKRERPRIPVVLLTSLADPLDVIRGLEVGADSFLTKPYAPEHLVARLELLLANRRERATDGDHSGLSIRFMDQRFVVEAGREQILDLLVTTFDDAVRQNRELQQTVRALERAQEELARKERLAVLGKLSGSVGHELRNPLGVMTNAVYFLNVVLADPPEKVKEYLGILRHQIMLSEKIVADLLDFARVKPPQRTVTEVPRLVGDQIARVTVPPNVQVVTRFPEPLTVEIDPIQVGQVLLNLIANGVQAMEEAGGVLTIAAEARDGRVTISVEDTGPGVSAEHRAMIFEPLFTTKARGIGLGLAVSRSLAQANGGGLVLGNGAGPGARFELELPRAAAGA